MAIVTAQCTAGKQAFLNGDLEPGDTNKIALYTSSATLGAATAAYTATNEISGTGYTAAGQALTGFTAASDGTTSYIDFTTDPSWTTATFTTAGFLIYNDTESNNRAILSYVFAGDQTVSAGTFSITFPAAAAATALYRWA